MARQNGLKAWAFAAVAWWSVLGVALVWGTEGQDVIPVPATAVSTTSSSTTSTSTTTTTTQPSGVKHRKGKCPTYEQVFAEYGLEPVQTFSYIAWRESRCQPDALNTTLNRDGSFDTGLLQINSTWKTVTRNVCGGGLDLLFDLDCNLRVAKYLLDNGGLAHWGIDG